MDDLKFNPLEPISKAIVEYMENSTKRPEYIIMNYKTFFDFMESPFVKGIVPVIGEFPGFCGIKLILSTNCPEDRILVAGEGQLW